MTENSNVNGRITVFGAYGHTGKFVVAELLNRGFTPILSGRNKDKLEALGNHYPDLEIRPVVMDDVSSLDNALDGSIAVINCAGPFLDSAIPVIEAALRKRVHYLDIAAEQQCVLTTYEKFGEEALERGIVIIPAMAFYGGLADLLATAAMGDWPSAENVAIRIALDSWMPTAGTRLTGQRNTSQRLIFSGKRLEPVPDNLHSRQWQFAEPFNLQEVVQFPLSEIITISKHLDVNEIETFINLAPINDIHNANTPPPMAADETGRSSQIFLMEVEVRSGNKLRKAAASGRDIYAITAPLIVEAIVRITEGKSKKEGVLSAGQAFDAADFLRSLSPGCLSIDLTV